MKYQEIFVPKEIKMLKEGQLRVWHIPQVPCKSFKVYVNTVQEAKKILETLAIYELFKLEYKIKPDYSNAQGLEVYEDGEWCDWYNEDGEDIDDYKVINDEDELLQMTANAEKERLDKEKLLEMCKQAIKMLDDAEWKKDDIDYKLIKQSITEIENV